MPIVRPVPDSPEKEKSAECLVDDEPMFDRDARIKSFGETGMWYQSGPSEKNHMADSGLYVPDEDHRKRKYVKCAYCRHKFLDWTRDQVPNDRHLSESPECQFIKMGKTEMDLTISELLQLQEFAAIQKVKEEYENEKEILVEKFEEMKKLL